jgi:crossover junction endodeoxyribonuclease RusA
VELVIHLPLPTPALQPNSRAHWIVKARETKQYRQRAMLEARSILPHDWQPMEYATVQCVFTFAQRRRRDGDNLLASMKAAYDGLRDAGVVVDDCRFTHLPVLVNSQRGAPSVCVKITEQPLL